MAKSNKMQLRGAALAERQALADPVAGLEWRKQAHCAETDPEVFYPTDEKWSEPAKRVCAGCPVAAQCLAYALVAGEPFGVWGEVPPERWTGF